MFSSIENLLRFSLAGLVLLVFTAASPRTLSAQEFSTSVDAEEGNLPSIDDLEAAFKDGRPSAEELLEGEARDWIVLKDDSVFVAKAVYPRPDTLEKLAERLAEARKKKDSDAVYEANRVTIFPPDTAEEMKISVSNINKIISHEDLMLRRVDEMIANGSISDAYKHLLNIDQRVPGWSQTAPRHENLIFREGQIKAQAGEYTTALILFEDLLQRNSSYPKASQAAGAVVDRLTNKAFKEKDFHRAQYYTRRLQQIVPTNPVVKKWNGALQKYADDKLTKAGQLTSSGNVSEATELAADALRAWQDNQTRNRAGKFLNRFQRLVVAVQSLPGQKTGYPVQSAGDRRLEELLQVNLFEPKRRDEMAYFESDFFEQWEPLDLGRRVKFRLNRVRGPWQSQFVATAQDLAETFSIRLYRNSPFFDERLYSYVKSYRVNSPYEFEIGFQRVPLRLESILTFPVSRIDSEGKPELASPRFKVVKSGDSEFTYDRAVPEKDGAQQYHVARVVERKYDSHEKALQGLLRNEVQLMPHLHPWEVSLLQNDRKKRFIVKKYRLPISHSIQFNPNSDRLNTNLRKALDYSIDRQTMLDKYILRRNPASEEPARGRVVTAPYWKGCYANSPIVGERPFDLGVGVAMVTAADLKEKNKAKAEYIEAENKAERDPDPEEIEKIMNATGNIPTLRMLCAPDPTARVAAEAIVSQMKRIGLTIELLPENTITEDWDLLYRTSRMVEPLVELWPFMAIDAKARVESLAHLPDWLGQELVNLENAGSFASATERLHQLHRHLAAEGHFISLWEVDEYMAIDKRISNVPDEPLGVYQDIERWIIRW